MLTGRSRLAASAPRYTHGMMERLWAPTARLGMHLRLAPGRLWLGLALVAAAWTISWGRVVPLSDYTFFPLWLGYVLTVDGLIVLRTGTSPLTRAGWRIGWWFAASVPLWWIFELFNKLIQDWHYHSRVQYTFIVYHALASLAFSTVIPAVLTTSELVRSFGRQPLRRLPAMRQTRGRLIAFHLAGWAMIGATVAWPSYVFPLVWLSLIFLLDPLVSWMGGHSIGKFLECRNWSPVSNLALGALLCGWFWEMWNYYALPKWSYTIPHVGWWHVWEMPILGYGGYFPFGVEVYVFYEFCRCVLLRVRLPEAWVSSREGSSLSHPEAAASG